MCSRADDPTMHDIAAAEGVTEDALRAALSQSHPDASPSEVLMRAHDLSILDTADPALNPHPFRHPVSAMNDHCTVCGEYEEDGPHIG